MADRQESRTYDVVIVGMGPGGASAASALSRGGLSVLGFDKETHPRYKVCGGGLSARVAQLLDPGFQSVVEHAVNGVQFVYRGQDPILIESSEPIAYMVMRDRFDHYLLQQARSRRDRYSQWRRGDRRPARIRRRRQWSPNAGDIAQRSSSGQTEPIVSSPDTSFPIAPSIAPRR